MVGSRRVKGAVSAPTEGARRASGVGGNNPLGSADRERRIRRAAERAAVSLGIGVLRCSADSGPRQSTTDGAPRATRWNRPAELADKPV